jgi:hypothetical protein
MLLPQASLQAAGPAARPAARATQAPVFVDVALHADSTFVGSLVDPQGKPIEGAAVSIRQGKNEVARTTSGRDGTFAVNHLRGGTYHVVAGQSEGLFRLWAENTAPPSAYERALIVAGGPTVRGQYGGIDAITLITLGAAITGVTLAAINLSKLDDLDDKISTPASP